MKIGELERGDHFVSPAGRLETIIDISYDRTDLVRAIWTDRTGEGYAWHLWASHEVQAIKASSLRPCGVWVVGISGRNVGAIAYIGPDGRYPWGSVDHHVLAQSSKIVGAGTGWRVTDRPNGGELVQTEHATKAAADAAVRKAARAHAKALGLKMEVVQK